LPLFRYLTKSLLAATGIWQEYVLILGTDSTALKIAANLEKDRYLGYRVHGFLRHQKPRQKMVKIHNQKFRVFGNFQEAERILVETGIRQVIIAVPGLSSDELVLLTNELQPYTKSILIVPDLMGIPVVGGETEYFFDDRILAYRTKNNLANPANKLIKHIFDISVGLLLSILLVPFLIIISAAIKIDSKGPIIFVHKRVGFQGKEFNCYKFRTMVANSQQVLEEIFETNPDLQDKWEEDFKLKDDPRITKLGKILRQTSLDELPQLFNVLKCEMSLVGPRPIVKGEIHKFGQHIKEYLMVLPGMTGLWVNSGRNDVDYDERVQMEAWYVHNWSLWMDISLLFRTIPVVFGRKGAY
jgi:undecaprenyl-phosphate galactose phosphotransferase